MDIARTIFDMKNNPPVKEGSNMNIYELAEELIERVKREMISVSITAHPDGEVEVMISPWESYQPRCPYGKEKTDA